MSEKPESITVRKLREHDDSPEQRRESALRSYKLALRRCPPPNGGIHDRWLWKTARFAHEAEVPMAEAEAAITQAMTRPPDPPNEVATAVANAYGAPGKQVRQRVARAMPLPKTRERFIQRGGELGGTVADWAARSPVKIDWQPGPADMVAVLRALWRADEFLFAGDKYGKAVFPVAKLIRRFERGGTVPPHLIINPLCGQAVPNPKQAGKLSARCDEAVVGFRYAVAEMDDMSREAQLQFWAGFTSAPIAALVDSGGKSIHAWLRVDCPDREAWERDVEQGLFERVLIPFGCDRTCRNESRLSRAPGHYRMEKQAWQRLLYLNPKAGL